MASKRQVFTQDALDKIKKKLDEQPDKIATYQKQEAIQALSGSIVRLRAIGYAWEDIAALLLSEGIEIKASTLKNYVGKKSGKDAVQGKPAATEPKPKPGARKSQQKDTPPRPATESQPGVDTSSDPEADAAGNKSSGGSFPFTEDSKDI